jgi:hypothetical protein
VLTRRALLGAAVLGVGAATAGCRSHHAVVRRPAVDPDSAALAAARAQEQALVAQLDRLIARAPAALAASLGSTRSAHLAHLDALTSRRSDVRTPARQTLGARFAVVDRALRQSVPALARAADAAHGGHTAAVLASIAAAHAAELRS